MAKKKHSVGEGRIATNRRARFDYEILDTVEAGIVLLGPEVKSLRQGNASLGEAYAMLRRGEAWLRGMHIAPYEQAGRENPEPLRERKLLLHRHELRRLQTKVTERGNTLVPLSLYWKDGRAKVELALVRGKRQTDKRETIRRREEDREMRRAIRGRGRR
ncbi:MAG: SsrA-binding protein SmpB [bacterium]|nr:SsrA-binding protein SmpB [bacterium]MCP5066651.1 SsrA-binding protein SmpB [bacterium]